MTGAGSTVNLAPVDPVGFRVPRRPPVVGHIRPSSRPSASCPRRLSRPGLATLPDQVWWVVDPGSRRSVGVLVTGL